MRDHGTLSASPARAWRRSSSRCRRGGRGAGRRDEPRSHGCRSAGSAPARLRPVTRRYFVTTFGCQMNAHDSERIKGMLEELGLGEAAERRGGRRRRLQHLHDPREARHEARRLPRRGERAQAARPRPRDRRRRLLRRGAARADLRALPRGRRRLRPRLDRASRRLARRGRGGGRARPLRPRRPRVRGDAADAPRAAVPGVGAGLDGLQLGLLLLHRPGRARPRAEPPARARSSPR